MARDIGGYFEQLTRKARGGRRLESDGGVDGVAHESSPSSSSSKSPSRSSGKSSGGGLSDVLKDILRKGKSAASTTSKSAADKAREQVARRRKQKRSRRTSTGRRLPPEGVVSIEYTPSMDGDPDPGEVVWTWVPFEEDPEQGKDRPVVIIGRRGRGLVGVPLTTKRDDREAQIEVGTGEWDPKRRTSYARIWRMLDIDEDRTRREGAVLERRRFDAVVEAVDEYYEVRRTTSASGADNVDHDD